MHVRYKSLFILMLAGFLTLSLIRGQERFDRPAQAPEVPVKPVARETTPVAPRTTTPALDPASLEEDPRRCYFDAKRGAEWLTRMIGVNGRFLNGWVPSLNVPLEGDEYHRQAGAAFALARVARLTGEERYSASAARALLSLLDETVLDTTSQVRNTPLPSVVVNRLGSAALLVLAINELPAPPPDLLEKSEQLCTFIRRQARSDGSLACGDLLADGRFPTDDLDALNRYPGQALYALARSAKYRPADWKLALVRNALGYYLPWWRAHRNLPFVPWQTAAYAEAYQLSHDRAFADAVFEMNDWLTGLQYDLARNSQHPEWVGGFRSWEIDRAVDVAPSAQAADCGETLAFGCRVARQLGDERRQASYGDSLLACLQFIATLQYREANTTHFVHGYRERLVGGVHLSTQDGTLRIDYTHHAVSAMVLFVETRVAR